MTLGDINSYGDSSEQLNPSNLSHEEVAKVLNTHLYDARESDDFEITAEMVEEDMIGFGREPLLKAILEASGYSMTSALQMENIEMLNKIDDPGKLMELAESQS
ncbi:hypothetical protein [Natronoglomus mannanivorans]|uniref:Uncharacterized protein n=1 Tax=Natronoglomus mannanivorans TaxID=2979990 RepID=A0AAP2Z5S6_9EURY|nr:hypothetical protein [Halobacteria archaeon AArc-xg1-1]